MEQVIIPIYRMQLMLCRVSHWRQSPSIYKRTGCTLKGELTCLPISYRCHLYRRKCRKQSHHTLAEFIQEGKLTTFTSYAAKISGNRFASRKCTLLIRKRDQLAGPWHCCGYGYGCFKTAGLLAARTRFIMEAD
jgi:hypothetical protein